VLDELSPEEVAGAVVALLAYGGQVADGLAAALGSHSQYVRHACALSLAQLKLGRSLPALLHQVQAETTPSWVEMARALGEFGVPALSSVTAALLTSERRERLMVSLAHLANHGCLDEIQALEGHTDSTVALAARQALARRTRIDDEDQAIRTQQPLRDNSPESRFSQVFFAELTRMQP
jgi:HEAT repeat protein